METKALVNTSHWYCRDRGIFSPPVKVLGVVFNLNRLFSCSAVALCPLVGSWLLLVARCPGSCQAAVLHNDPLWDSGGWALSTWTVRLQPPTRPAFICTACLCGFLLEQQSTVLCCAGSPGTATQPPLVQRGQKFLPALPLHSACFSLAVVNFPIAVSVWSCLSLLFLVSSIWYNNPKVVNIWSQGLTVSYVGGLRASLKFFLCCWRCVIGLVLAPVIRFCEPDAVIKQAFVSTHCSECCCSAVQTAVSSRRPLSPRLSWFLVGPSPLIYGPCGERAPSCPELRHGGAPSRRGSVLSHAFPLWAGILKLKFFPFGPEGISWPLHQVTGSCFITEVAFVTMV